MGSDAVQRLFHDVAFALRPPEELSYSEWAEKNFRLPSSSAAPGRFRPWRFQRGPLDAIGDPKLERVTIIKSARTGFTTSLVAGIGAISANDPCPIILLMPRDEDARGIVVDEIDPAFKETPALKGLLPVGRYDGRNTLTHRTFLGGGSLKILSATSPGNLRRHTARVLYCDEVDAMKPTVEGDPVALAEKRTMSFPDRKIVIGSTPTEEGTSIVARQYALSDRRIFEVPCIHCGTFFEILWDHLDWRAGDPESVVCVCPNCLEPIEEKYKPQMVDGGSWRATAPEVKGHAGFRMNALISLFANASWPKLIDEYERARKAGPTMMMQFTNTVLGQTWKSAIDYVDENQLLARREPFGIAWDQEESRWRQDIPEDVSYITAGVDVQGDRLEITLLGWSSSQRYILGHLIVRGSPLLQTTWEELDALLGTIWRHPLGGPIGIEAVCIDSSAFTQKVYDYCEVVQGRKIVAIKGDEGPRPIMKAMSRGSKNRRNRTATAYVLGVDQLKTDILMSLPLEKGEENAIRFCDTLDEEYFIQLTSERRVLKMKNGKPVVGFERIGNRKAEALDTVVYAIAAKQLCRFDFAGRIEVLTGKPQKRGGLKEALARLHS